jgi:leucyl aminopeptidase (aminopeptidase T)
MNIFQLIEAQEGARRILEPNLKAGESLAIIGSTDVDPKYYEVLIAVATSLELEPTLGLMTPRTTYGKPAPESLEAQAAAADMSLLTPSTSLAHTSTALNTLKAGKRVATFPVPPGKGRAVDVLRDQRIYDMEKLKAIKDLCMRCAKALDSGKEVKVVSPLGTDLTVKIDGRTTHSWYGFIDEEVYNYTAWPPGDAHLSAIEDSANGIAVCDGYIGGMGIPDEPLFFEFKNGKLESVTGKDAPKFEKILAASDENARVFAEVGLGTNPWQEPVNSNGDKYITGTFHFAFGASATPCFCGVNFDGKNYSNLHLDCLMYAPVDVFVDGQRIVGDGKILV